MTDLPEQSLGLLERAGWRAWLELHPAGLARIETAKADGSWALLEAVDALEVPEDLQAALEQSGGLEHFSAFPRSVKRGILEWIAQARSAATRIKRIEETATLAARNERANQWLGKSGKFG
jgi:uncharacterized protein YdeI (YjbR/CyaY-like superfamily)